MPSARRLREHVRDLAKEMDVQVVVVGTTIAPGDIWGQAQHHPADVYEKRKKRLVLLSHRPTTPMTYMVAMHELGHCATADGWSADKTLDREAAAWEWAIANAIISRPLASHHARIHMRHYRDTPEFSRSDYFERVYNRVTRNSRPYRQRKR